MPSVPGRTAATATFILVSSADGVLPFIFFSTYLKGSCHRALCALGGDWPWKTRLAKPHTWPTEETIHMTG